MVLHICRCCGVFKHHFCLGRAENAISKKYMVETTNDYSIPRNNRFDGIIASGICGYAYNLFYPWLRVGRNKKTNL